MAGAEMALLFKILKRASFTQCLLNFDNASIRVAREDKGEINRISNYKEAALDTQPLEFSGGVEGT
jgi:hypothetical protein